MAYIVMASAGLSAIACEAFYESHHVSHRIRCRFFEPALAQIIMHGSNSDTLILNGFEPCLRAVFEFELYGATTHLLHRQADGKLP